MTIASTSPVKIPLVNPYCGLRPFEKEDADRFFGRDEEIEQLLRLISTRRFVTVLGVSGSGKSSLVRAGVLPIVQTGFAAGLGGRWHIVTMMPGKGPLTELCKKLQAEFPGNTGLDDKWPQTSFALTDFARSALSHKESLMLLVDQFEELFAFRRDSLARDGGSESAAFVNLLLNATGQTGVSVYVVLTMRSDYLGEAAQFRGLPEAMNDAHYLVPRMTRFQQQEAIERQVQEQKLTIDPALVQRLLNDSAENPDDLPILQHLLKCVWEKWALRQKKVGEPIEIEMTDYDEAGGWGKALESDGEAVLKEFPAEEAGIRRVFQWITETGTGERPRRRPRPFSECVAISGVTTERLEKAATAFQSRNFLRSTNKIAGSSLDFSHESVLWHWPKLKGWIAEEAVRATQIRFLWESARQKNPVTGVTLEWGLNWSQECERTPLANRYLTQEQFEQTRTWLVKSKKAERSGRRQQALLVWASLALVLAVGVVWAVWRVAREQKRSAEASQLFAGAVASMNDDPARSLILGLHSWAKKPSMVPGLETLLHKELRQSLIPMTLTNQTGTIRSIAWSPDGNRLAVGNSSGTVDVLEASTGRTLITLTGHQGAISSIAWSPDGTKLATASLDSTAKVYNASTGRELLTLTGHRDAVTSVAWSPDGRRLVTGSDDNTFGIWNAVPGGKPIILSTGQAGVTSVAWSPDGSKLATASADTTIKVWQAASCKVWPVGSCRELLLLGGDQGPVSSIAWSPDGKKLAAADGDHTAIIWDADSGHVLTTLNGHQGSVSSIAWSPDGRKLASASADQTAKVWEVPSGHELLTLRGHRGPVAGVAWSPDGNSLATASSDNIKIWRTGVGYELRILQGHQGAIIGIAWSPDGSKLVTASADRTAKVWPAASTNAGGELLTLTGHLDRITSVAWSPDGRRLATGSYDSTAKVWDASTGEALLTLHDHKGVVSSVAWSPDGSKLVTGSYDSTAKVWDAATGSELLTLTIPRGGVSSVAWSPDGSKLTTGSTDSTARVWDAATGHELLTLAGHTAAINDIVWSPDSSKLATGSNDGTVRVWRASGDGLLTLPTPQTVVASVAWSPDGSKLAAGTFTGTVRVWDSTTGLESVTIEQQAAIACIAWSPDGKQLAAGKYDKTTEVYAIDATELVRLARSRVTRSLTADECRQYFNDETCPSLPQVP